ncbi:MAG: protein kinase, partial [Candidatus Eisenbacteria bacterium]|nr:protein kinase [Candidatus Eisenbacteria bacterium]
MHGGGNSPLSPHSKEVRIPRLAGFRVLRHAGMGSSATVYEAVDVFTGSPVALKLLRTDRSEPSRVNRFATEFDLLLDLGGDPFPLARGYHLAVDGRPYISMEWIQGLSLAETSSSLSWSPRTLRRMHSLALALESLHSRGWLHMDLKPANIILEDSRTPGSSLEGRVRIIDIGLMVRFGATIEPRGTPGYMAPELFGKSPLDTKCDLFSLGCLYYRMLTGVDPFAAAEVHDVIRRQAGALYLPLDELAPGLPPPLVEVIVSLLQAHPGARPASAGQIVRELKRIASLEAWKLQDSSCETGQPGVPQPWPPVPRPEMERVEAFLLENPRPSLALAKVAARPGLGRGSFARDLANRLSKKGIRNTLLTAIRTSSGSRQSQQNHWEQLIRSGCDEHSEVSQATKTLTTLGETIWKRPGVLIFDLGDIPPAWFREWFDQLSLAVTSASFRHPRGDGPLGCMVISGKIIETRGGDLVENEEFVLRPLPESLLVTYLENHSATPESRPPSRDILRRLVAKSQGYPEVLQALRLDTNTRTSPEPTSDTESPLQILRRHFRGILSELNADCRDGFAVLEMSSVPLDIATWGLATGLTQERITAAAESLMQRGLILRSTAGYEIAFPEFFESEIIRDPHTRQRYHASLAAALRSRSWATSSDDWLAIAKHEIQARISRSSRFVLCAALRLVLEQRIADASKLLIEWFDHLGKASARADLWCLRLRLQLLWELGDEEEFERAALDLPRLDPVKRALVARQLARKGRAEEALAAIDSIDIEHLNVYLKSFVLGCRALVAQSARGAKYYCNAAEECLKVFPPRALLGMRGVLLIRLVQAALWMDRVEAAETASNTLGELARSTGSTDLECRAALSRAALAKHRGDYRVAQESAREALRLARMLGNANQIVASLSQVGSSSTELGHWEEAVGAKEECVAIAKVSGNLAAAVNE